MKVVGVGTVPLRLEMEVPLPRSMAVETGTMRVIEHNTGKGILGMGGIGGGASTLCWVGESRLPTIRLGPLEVQTSIEVEKEAA